MISDLGKFILRLAQLSHLSGDHFVLLLQTQQQRRQLWIDVIFCRVVKIKLIDRLDDPLALPGSKDQRENKDYCRNQQHQRQHRQ